MKVMILVLISLIIISCNKTNTHVVNDDSKLGITMEIKIKDSYYLDEDIIIEIKMINNSQNDIYLEDSEPYCDSLYKKLNLNDQEQLWASESDKEFYLFEPSSWTGTPRYVTPPLKFKHVLKSHNFERFSCEYNHYDKHGYGNQYLLQSGLYKTFTDYSFKTEGNPNKISVGKKIIFRVKDRLSFWDIFFIVLGLIVFLGAFIGAFKYYNKKW